MASISFYKDRTNWNDASVGSVMFDTSLHQIFLRTAENVDVAFGNVRDAQFIEESAPGEGDSADKFTRVLKIWKTGDADNNPSINLDLSDLASATAVDSLITALETQLADVRAKFNDYYTKTDIDSKLGSTFAYKGSVETYSDLPTEGNKVGDVWNIKSVSTPPSEDRYGTTIKAGDNVVWGEADGTVAAGWDVLSGVMSGLATDGDIAHLQDQVNALNEFAGGNFVASIKGNVKGKEGATLQIAIKPTTATPATGKQAVTMELDTTTLDETIETIKQDIITAMDHGVLSINGKSGHFDVESNVEALKVLFTFERNPENKKYIMRGSVRLPSAGSSFVPVYSTNGTLMPITLSTDSTKTADGHIATDSYVVGKVNDATANILTHFNWKNW